MCPSAIKTARTLWGRIRTSSVGLNLITQPSVSHFLVSLSFRLSCSILLLLFILDLNGTSEFSLLPYHMPHLMKS